MLKKIFDLRTAATVVIVCLVAAVAWGVGNKSAQTAPATMDDYESLKIFTDVVSIVKDNYTEEVDTREIVYGAVKGMLKGLDPHSSFMTPEEYSEMQVDTKGSFGGIGIEIGTRGGVLTVISPIEDTPAHRAGLEAGDAIVKIEGKTTKEMSLMGAVKLMRGEKGTPLTITIMRKGFTEPKDVTIVRDIIKIQSVKHRVLEEGIGYVRITQFQEKTSSDLEKALKELGGSKGELKGLILDLRNNPGGLLNQAVEVSDKFLSEGLIVYTKGRIAGQNMEFSATEKDTQSDYPIIVMVNTGSASASEIVAGALQDHKRAVVLGTQTFGKGSVQTVIPLNDGSAVRLTTSKYYTPSGRSIQAMGIEPDIIVGAKLGERVTEKDLEGHLEGGDDTGLVDEGADEETDVDAENGAPEKKMDKLDKDKKPGEAKSEDGDKDADKNGKKVKVKEEFEKEAVVKAVKEGEDIQLNRALDYLKSWLIFQGTMKPAA
jgi:carboxyl-terminal processing protease